MQLQGSYQFSNLNKSSKVTRRHAIYNRQISDFCQGQPKVQTKASAFG